MTVMAEDCPVAVPETSTGHSVVAVVLEWRGKIALLKRSAALNYDAGRWHCVTGYLEPGVPPDQQAWQELIEETGLESADLLDFTPGGVLELNDDLGASWTVHTYVAVTVKRRLVLDWEHESFRWVVPEKTARFDNRVAWLDRVLHATGHLRR